MAGSGWPSAVPQSLHEAGDLALLDEVIPFVDGGAATWYQHLLLAVRFYDDELGEHGLVLMRDGDWTDPINGPGRFGKGESGWASMALAYACKQVAELARLKGDSAAQQECLERAQRHIDAVDTHLWIGDRYAYGFDDDGIRYGEERDGRTYLNVQTWAILAGCGDAKRQQACKNAIDRLMCPFGPRLLAPPFPGWDPQVGRLSIKVPGFGENGSVYCHGAAFAAAAMGALGEADASYDIMRRTMPTNPEHPPAASKQIPIWQPNAWFANLSAADAGHSTEALATGTTTWLLLTTCEYLAGMRARRLDGLHLMRPQLPTDWDGFSCTRLVHGTRYQMTVHRGDRNELLIDGQESDIGLIAFDGVETHTIQWTIAD